MTPLIQVIPPPPGTMFFCLMCGGRLIGLEQVETGQCRLQCTQCEQVIGESTVM